MSQLKQRNKQKTAPNHPLLEARSQLEEAERLRQEGMRSKARKICEGLLKRYPDYVGALHTLGLIVADMGDFKQAQVYLSQAAALNPKDWVTLTALSGVYLNTGAREMAAQTLERALESNPDEATVLATLGEIYSENKEYELAVDTFRRVTKVDPTLDTGWIGLGSTLAYLGEYAEAARAFEELVGRGKYTAGFLYQLGQLPPSLVKTDVLSLIDGTEKSPKQTTADHQSTAEFARAAALDRKGRHAEAWESLVAANALVCEQHMAEFQRDKERRMKFMARAKDSPVLDNSKKQDETCPVSLFIFGPSRSGKTTMEGLIGKLDGVKRGYENPIIENAAARSFQTAGLPTRRNIIELPPPLNDLCRNLYLEELMERAGGARVFTNTHPGRVFDAYRMAAIFPNTRFIFIKRDINDIALRIFGKKYSSGNDYAYNLETIIEYVTWYYEAIDMLVARMPEISTIVQYEDMIDNPSAVLAEAAKLCGLDYDGDKKLTVGDDRSCAAPYLDLMAQHSS